MRLDIMVDLETLGTGPDSTIFQIAAMSFDIKSGIPMSKFNLIADISKNKSYEMNVDGSTLLWWVKTDSELFARLLGKGRVSSSELIEEFHKWLSALCLTNEVYLWGNGILFDNNLLRTQMESNGLDYPIHYRRDRDVRTIVDLTCAKLGMEEKDFRELCYNTSLLPHDAFNDVANQILMVNACYKELTGSVFNETP